MAVEDFLSRERARRDAYKLLSECYYLPEEHMGDTLILLKGLMGDVCAAAVEHIPDLEEDIERLKIDYSKLFVGPFKLLAPPYGSVYLDGKRILLGDSTMDARNRYREAGLDIAAHFREAPDHIAVELEFMYYLVFKEVEAIELSDFRSAMEYLARQRGFLEDHLGVWVPEFAANVERNATIDFYRNLVRATRAFVQEDLNSGVEASMAELSSLMPAE